MKRIVQFTVILLLVAVGSAHGKTEIFGSGVTIKENTPVSAILDNPEEYVGKRVRIEGMILEVCAKRGCWVYLAGDRQGEKIQVKVEDGEIVFPMSLSGRMGAVEGIVEELKISREEMIQYLQHLAEEKGQPFDPTSVKDESLIRIKGLGAEIQG